MSVCTHTHTRLSTHAVSLIVIGQWSTVHFTCSHTLTVAILKPGTVAKSTTGKVTCEHVGCSKHCLDVVHYH